MGGSQRSRKLKCSRQTFKQYYIFIFFFLNFPSFLSLLSFLPSIHLSFFPSIHPSFLPSSLPLFLQPVPSVFLHILRLWLWKCSLLASLLVNTNYSVLTHYLIILLPKYFHLSFRLPLPCELEHSFLKHLTNVLTKRGDRHLCLSLFYMRGISSWYAFIFIHCVSMMLVVNEMNS